MAAASIRILTTRLAPEELARFVGQPFQAQGNRGTLLQDPQRRAQVRAIVFELLGRGEALP